MEEDDAQLSMYNDWLKRNTVILVYYVCIQGKKANNYEISLVNI